ncbi:serine hydrolase [Mesonia maritima]|uniref:serine hydrolase n=1 Tax=Mesonia maritima TaxID=1793873 RepID=UPI0036392F04
MIRSSTKKNFLKGYNIEGQLTPHWDFKTLEGAGAIRSTAKDMMSYLKANLGINANNLKDILAKIHKRRNQETALGWHLMQFNANEIVWHNGATYGFSSFIALDETNQKGIFILSNSGNIVDEMGIALLELIDLQN